MFLLYFIPSWFYYNYIEYILHSFSHNYNYKSYIYKLHKKHHLVHYPNNNSIRISPYKTDYYFKIFSDGFIANGIPFIGLLLIHCLILDKDLSININLCLLIDAYISDYIHTEIHIKDSWLEEYTWFQKKREKHLLHHKYLDKNFNIMTSFYDKMFNTYK